MRELIASGKARPEDIAIAAASPADFDDHIMALSADANIPIHFVHGLARGDDAGRADGGGSGRSAAERRFAGTDRPFVRTPALTRRRRSQGCRATGRAFCRRTPRSRPSSAGGRRLTRLPAEDWPEAIDRSNLVMDVLRSHRAGTRRSGGDRRKTSSGESARALAEARSPTGRPHALTVTLAQLRVPDGLEPASNVIWTSAISLASAPRPFVRLLALNSGRWPRRISEDRLIPDHIIPIEELDPLPIADGDRRDFLTILASARSASDLLQPARRRAAACLARSPLIGDLAEIYLSRGRTPEHAASEADRLLARPGEFRKTPIAVSGVALLAATGSKPEITAHDGLVGRGHPRLQNVFTRPHVRDLAETAVARSDPLRLALCARLEAAGRG